MSDEIKKPEEITDVPLPEKEMSAEELNKMSGGNNSNELYEAQQRMLLLAGALGAQAVTQGSAPVKK